MEESQEAGLERVASDSKERRCTLCYNEFDEGQQCGQCNSFVCNRRHEKQGCSGSVCPVCNADGTLLIPITPEHKTRLVPEGNAQQFVGQYDEEGVFVYQAFNNEIAAWAIENQRFGGAGFKPDRMTWVKPSFAWVLYRSGYARKHNQTKILKIKVSHETMAHILAQSTTGHGGGGKLGRVQWDPSRDLMNGDGKKEPHKLTGRRAIQIGVKGELSKYYVANILSIEDVTELAHSVQEAHKVGSMEALLSELPLEVPYMPHCSPEVLERLGMLEGAVSEHLWLLGRGAGMKDKAKRQQKHPSHAFP